MDEESKLRAQLAAIERKKHEEAQRLAAAHLAKEQAAADRAAEVHAEYVRGEVADAFPRARAAYMSASFE